MDKTISPIKRVIVSRANPSPPVWWVTPATNSMLSHVTPLANATATRAVTGKPSRVWAAESVITPVIVPGLAANRIKGVRDARAAEGVSDGAGEDDVCPLSMEKPIHA